MTDAINELNNYDENTFRYKNAKDILATMRDYTLTHTNTINDFTAGSAIETLYEAVATELEMYYYMNVTNIQASIDNSIYTAFGFGKQPELKAYGNVIIDFGEPLASAVQISKGVTIFSNDDFYDQTFETLDSYVVPAGTVTYEITVYCTEGGSYGNVPAGVLNGITNVSGVNSVQNLTAISTGQDEESLLETRIRFREFIQALQRGTVQAVKYGVMEVPQVANAYVDESVGFVRVYAHDANGDLSNGLRKTIQNNTINWRPAGIPVEIYPIHKTIVDIDIALDVPNQTLKTNDLLNKVRSVITNYINSKGAKDGITHNDVIQKIMDIDDLGITNTTADIKVYPDQALLNGYLVSDQNSIIINEHKLMKSTLEPTNRSLSEGYINNPEDRDDNGYPYKDSDYTEIPVGDYTSTDEGQTKMSASMLSFSRSNPITSSITVYSDNGEVVFNYNLKNGAVVQFKLNSNKQIQSVVFTTQSGDTFSLYLGLDGYSTVNYKTSEGETFATDLSLGVLTTFKGYQVLVSSDRFYINNLSTDENYTVYRNSYQINVSQNNITSSKVDAKGITNYVETSNDSDETLSYTIYEYTSDTTVEKYFNSQAVSIGSKLSYTLTNGNKQEIEYNKSGNVISNTIYGSNNQVISKQDGDGNSLVTTTSTTESDSGVSTTVQETSTTTTSTTANPFQRVSEVSAEDAPLDGFLPVFNQYNAQSNELLKAGYINVTFNN